jgi:arabinogalactan oligomer/maltooligosaccharide transport system permease protein
MTTWLRRDAWRHLIMLVTLVFALFPLLYVLSAAVNPLGTLSSSDLVPRGVGLQNLHRLFANPNYPFPKWFANSCELALLSSFTSVFLGVCAAYAFSRMRFRGRRVGLMALLLIQMFPQFLAVVTIIMMFSTIGRLWPAFGFNSMWGLLLLYQGMALGVNTYLMKGFLDTVPRELDQAAAIDGATHAQIFFKIILPLVRPIIAVTGLLSFIGIINEFPIANIFLQDPGTKTLAVGMYGMLGPDGRDVNFGAFAMSTLLTAVPTVGVFLWLQKYIVKGLTAGAVKG